MSLTKDGFYKQIGGAIGNNNYVLLAGGGHKLESNLNVAYASNADTLDGYHASGLFTVFGNSGNNITATIGGTAKTFTVNYASNSDTVDSYHANRFAFTYNSANYGSSSGVTVNDLVTNGVSNASHGMIYAATDNPVGSSNWVHVWSQQWTIGTTSSWVSQIALGVQQGTGMWYRTYSGNIVGRGWTRVLDSSNYTSYVNNYYWANVKVSTSSQTNTTPQLGGLYVINDSSNNSYDGLGYFRAYTNNDWGLIVDKSTSYTYGIDIRAGGEYALRVNNGKTHLVGATIIGADATPSYTLDVRGTTRSTGRIYANEWIEFSQAYTGLYWPNANNQAHFHPNNNTSYGTFTIRGNRNGYSGIQLGTTTSYMTIMDNGNDKGAYEEDWGWIWYFNRSNKKMHLRTSSDMGADINLNGHITALNFRIYGSAAAWNCNDAYMTGHFYYTSNGPSTSLGATTSDGALYSQAYNSSWVGQIAQDYRNGGLYVRGKNNGTWQSWYRVWDNRTTYVSGGKGYIGGTEITQVNNSDTVDGHHQDHLLPYRYTYGQQTNSGSTDWYVRIQTASYISEDCTIYVRGTGNNTSSDLVIHVLCRENRFWGWETSYNGVRINGITKETGAPEIIYLRMPSSTTSITFKSTHSLTIDKADYSSKSYMSLGEGLFANYIYGRIQNADYADTLTNPGKYYWANIPMQTSSDSTKQPTFGRTNITYAATNGTSALQVNIGSTNYAYGVDIQSSIAAGNTAVSLLAGVNHSTNNQLSGLFYYAGNNSTSNRFGFGFYGNDNILNIRADKRVGICTTAPAYTLDVTGTIRATSRIYANEWIQFDNYTGIYSPNNSAHFYPNNSTSYGQWLMQGARGGYSGIQFGTNTGYMTIMDNQEDKGLYEQDWNWILYFNRRNKNLSLRSSSSLGYNINLYGSVGTDSHMYSYGFHHLSHNNDDAVLLAGGGWEYKSNYYRNLGGGNYITITVGGDANTYYPVVIGSPSDYYPYQFVNITRHYSETAPDTWNTSTHKGGLSMAIFWNGSSYWDGNASGSEAFVVRLYQSYCTMVGGVDNSTAGKVVWLRGGGANYHIFSMNGRSQSATVYLSTYTDSASRSFAPRTTPVTPTVQWPGDVQNGAGYLRDRSNGTATYANYGAAGLGLGSITWLTCWNGYELRAISKGELGGLTNVYQHTGNNVDYPLVWSNQNNTSTVQANQLHKSYSDLVYNPYYKTIKTAGGYIMGNASGYFIYRDFLGGSNLEAGFYFHSSGRESVVFANQYAHTGWIFVNGIKPSNRTQWNTLGVTPAVQIHHNALYINRAVRDADTSDYNLYVTGSQRIQSGSLHIFPTGGNYNDGIRLHARSSDNAWAAITFCHTDNAGDTGISANSWFLGNYSGNFYLNRGTSNGQQASRFWARQNGSGFTIGNIDWSSYTLEVGDTLRVQNGIVLGGYATWGAHYITGAGGRIYFGGNFHIDGYGRASNYHIYLNHYVSTNVYMVTGGGKVGINTADPQTKLDIRGVDKVSMSMDSANSYRFATSFKGQLHLAHASHGSGTGLNDGYIDGITFGVGSASYAGIFVQNSGSYGSKIIFSTTDDYSYNKARMIINHSGYVGIGTMTPGYKLDVNGTGRFVSRLYVNEWIEFSQAYTGLYWPNGNNASHFHPNDATTYGNFVLRGSRGGYSGITMGRSANYMTIMDNGTDKGLYNETNGRWIIYYNRSNNRVSLYESSVDLGYGVQINNRTGIKINSYPSLHLYRTDAGQTSQYFSNNTAGWAIGINPWGVGAGVFAIGQYSGTGSSTWRFKIDNNGYCYTNSYLNLGAGNEKNASNPPYVLGFNGSDTYIRSYQTGYLNVNYANYSGWSNWSHYLAPHYDGGDKPNPQQYFNYSIGVKVAMTRNTSLGGTSMWADTLWINGYTGSDVPNMCALTFARNASPRFFISTQSNRATSYGTYYEVASAYNTYVTNGYGYILGTYITKLYPVASNPDNSHPGYGCRVFYSWNTGQAGNGSSGYSNGITIGSHPNDQAYGFQIVQNMWDDKLYFRRYNGGWQSWRTCYDNVYHPNADYATSAGNADTVDGYHANRFAFTYNSANYGNSSGVTVNDLVTNGVSNASHGMIYSGTDNPYSSSGNWVHVWSQQWTIGTTSSWVSQIALGVQQGTGMWYRTTSGNIVGRGWIRVLDSSNYTTYVNNYYWANVKVSTTSSTTTVPSFGAIRMNGASSAGTNYITGTAGRIYFGGNFHIDSLGSNATYINHYTSNNVYMVTGGGRVGIGNSSPSYKLHVSGDTYITGYAGIGTSPDSTYGRLVFPENNIAIGFRKNGSYKTSVQYMTTGNEALVFSTQQAVTSFIFKCGHAASNGSDWQSGVIGTPSVQIKQQSLYVNTAIANGATPGYNFYVTGSSYFSGAIWTGSTIYSYGFYHRSYGSATYLLRSDGGAAAFNWSGQSGQPTWIWGGNSQHTYYVYNPSNFRVANADTVDDLHASAFTRTYYSFASSSDNSETTCTNFATWVTRLSSHSGILGTSSITVGAWWWVRSIDFQSSVGNIRTSGAMIIHAGDGTTSNKNYKHFLILDAYCDLFGITSNEESHKYYAKFLSNRNSYVDSNGYGIINNSTITRVNYANSAGSATDASWLTPQSNFHTGRALGYYQAASPVSGTNTTGYYNNWQHVIMMSHDNGQTYYHYQVAFPFWGPPIYQRKEGGSAVTDNQSRWYSFITDENKQNLFETLSYSSSTLTVKIGGTQKTCTINAGSSVTLTTTNTSNHYVIGVGAGSIPSNGSSVTSVYARSEFYFTNSGAYHSSDARKKYDIRDILNDDVNKLFETENGFIRHFKWINTNEDAYGFIAQELQEYCPEAVDFNTDTGYYSVNYNVAFSKVIGAMFKKIKELERKLQEKENH